ncbi:leucine-rich repeat and transmembrane domain-containing protein 2-like isoform X2 [Periplaneta americana]
MWTKGWFLALLVCPTLPTGTYFDSCPSSACSCVASERDNDVIVTCSEQQLMHVPDIVSSRPITSLDLSNNELTFLDNSSFSQYDSIKYLDLSQNEIEIIDHGTFHSMVQLEELDLSLNDLLILHPEIFSHNPLLEAVILSGNPHLYIPENSPFIVSSSILLLDVSSCKLTSLYPETFSLLPKLHILDLNSNNLRNFPLSILHNLTNVKVLDIGNNLWHCKCELVILLEWVANLERIEGRSMTHRPVRCLKYGMIYTLISASDRDKMCQNVQLKEDMSVSPTQEVKPSERTVSPTQEVKPSERTVSPTQEVKPSERTVSSTQEVKPSERIKSIFGIDSFRDLDTDRKEYYENMIQEIEILDDMTMEETAEPVGSLSSWNMFYFLLTLCGILAILMVFSCVLAIYCIVRSRFQKLSMHYSYTDSMSTSHNDHIYEIIK